MDDSSGGNKRWAISERLGETSWILSERLFDGEMTDIYDFEPRHYAYFLDHVSSLGDLIAGLEELSPLADDALSVAEKMSERDFLLFKRMVEKERKGTSSKVPVRFRTLLFPANFLKAAIIAKEFEVCLGAALISLIEASESPPL